MLVLRELNVTGTVYILEKLKRLHKTKVTPKVFFSVYFRSHD